MKIKCPVVIDFDKNNKKRDTDIETFDIQKAFKQKQEAIEKEIKELDMLEQGKQNE